MSWSSIKQNLIIIGIVSVFGLFSLSGSFNLAIDGDDWLALYRYLITYNSLSSYFNPANFSTNYDIANILMGVIYSVFGFSPSPYYVISFVFRIVSALSIYIVVIHLNKNKLFALLAAITSICLYAGIETTNWVFNMNSYISIALFVLATLFIIRIKKEFTKNNLLLLSLMLFLSFFVSPTRLHGLIFIIPLIPFISIDSERKINLKRKFILFVSLVFPLLVFRLFTRSTGDVDFFIIISSGIRNFITLVIDITANIGSSILPDLFIRNFIQSESISQIKSFNTFIDISWPIILLLSTLLFFLKETKVFKPGLMIWGGLIIMTFLAFSQNLTFSNNLLSIYHLLVGEFFILFTLLYFVVNRKKLITISYMNLYFLYSSISLLIIPGLINQDAIFSSDHRYLIIIGNLAVLSLFVTFGKIYQTNKVSHKIY
jgi:hypothetical protein